MFPVERIIAACLEVCLQVNPGARLKEEGSYSISLCRAILYHSSDSVWVTLHFQHLI